MMCASSAVWNRLKMRFHQIRGKGSTFPIEQDGSVSIEFALLGPIFFGVVFSIFLCAVMFFFQFALMTSAEYASRQLITGQVSAGMSQEQFRQQVCQNLAAMMRCDDLMVDVQSAGVISSLDPSSVDLDKLKSGTSFNIGSGGDYVLVRLFYHINLPLKFPGVGFIAESATSTFIVATMLAKAEPY